MMMPKCMSVKGCMKAIFSDKRDILFIQSYLKGILVYIFIQPRSHFFSYSNTATNDVKDISLQLIS